MREFYVKPPIAVDPGAGKLEGGKGWELLEYGGIDGAVIDVADCAGIGLITVPAGVDIPATAPPGLGISYLDCWDE